MGMFGDKNSVEPGPRPRQKPEDVPVREATGAELGAMLRRERQEAKPKPDDVVAVRPTTGAAATSKAGDADQTAKQHNLFTQDKGSTRVYYRDYQQQPEVMRAGPAKISTKLDDRQTVAAVLDLAKERGWESLRLRGSREFKAEAWVQATLRGVATEGYAPTQTDKQELANRERAARPAEAAREGAGQAKAASIPVTAGPAPKAGQAPSVKEPATEAPKPAAAVPSANERKAVWSTVENLGKQAREHDTAKPVQKASAVAKQKSEAA